MPALDDPKEEVFARLVSQGKSKKQAAIEAGYIGKFISSVGTKLAKRERIRQRIDELNGKIEQSVVENVVRAETAAINNRLARVASLQDLHERLQIIVKERAADPTMQNVPGGKSGLLVRQIKALRVEPDAGKPNGGKPAVKLVPEFVFDSALAKELRATGQQAAQELGQWLSKEPVDDDRPVERVQFQWVEPTIAETGKPVSVSDGEKTVVFAARVQ